MTKSLYLLTLIIVAIAGVLIITFLHDNALISSSGQSIAECAPFNITYSNISSNSFTIEWSTTTNCVGVVKYGDDINNLIFEATERDASSKRQHTVILTSLKSATKYYFLIISNQKEYGFNNFPLDVTTKKY